MRKLRCRARLIHMGKGSNCQRLVEDFDFVHLSGAC